MIVRLLRPAELFDGEMLKEGTLVVIEEAIGEQLIKSCLALGPLDSEDIGNEVPFLLTLAQR